jgi:predicted Fe-Mo cluster-binding NifX family protein
MERTYLRYAAPLAGADDALSEHFGEAPIFALVTMRLKDGAVTERRTLVNPYLEEDRAKGIRVAEWMVEQKVDVVFLKESLRGKGPVYVFGDAGVEMRETGASTLDEAVEEARKGDAL